MSDHDLAVLIMQLAEALPILREEVHKRHSAGHLALVNRAETQIIRQHATEWRNALLATACRLTLAAEAKS